MKYFWCTVVHYDLLTAISRSLVLGSFVLGQLGLLQYLPTSVDMVLGMSSWPWVIIPHFAPTARKQMFGDVRKKLECIVRFCVAVPGHVVCNVMDLAYITHNEIYFVFVRRIRELSYGRLFSVVVMFVSLFVNRLVWSVWVMSLGQFRWWCQFWLVDWKVFLNIILIYCTSRWLYFEFATRVLSWGHSLVVRLTFKTLCERGVHFESFYHYPSWLIPLTISFSYRHLDPLSRLGVVFLPSVRTEILLQTCQLENP